MIIYLRQHQAYKGPWRQVISSVNIYDQVYIEIGGVGVSLSPKDALTFGEAIVRAANGKGIPAPPEDEKETKLIEPDE